MREELRRDRLYVAVDLMILTVRDGRLHLFLSRRGEKPFAGYPALPGRFVGLDETAETAVARLISEVLPVPEPFLEQLYTFADIDRDPRGRVVSIAYLAIVPWQKVRALQASGQTALRPFRVTPTEEGGLYLTGEDGETLSGSDLAFDHGRIVTTGIRRLRGKIDYTEIGFHFLTDRTAFSLGELQTVFEAVLGMPLDSSNFRRFILNRYEKSGRLRQTEQAEKKGRGRPAALYRFD